LFKFKLFYFTCYFFHGAGLAQFFGRVASWMMLLFLVTGQLTNALNLLVTSGLSYPEAVLLVEQASGLLDI